MLSIKEIITVIMDFLVIEFTKQKCLTVCLFLYLPVNFTVFKTFSNDSVFVMQGMGKSELKLKHFYYFRKTKKLLF